MKKPISILLLVMTITILACYSPVNLFPSAPQQTETPAPITPAPIITDEVKTAISSWSNVRWDYDYDGNGNFKSDYRMFTFVQKETYDKYLVEFDTTFNEIDFWGPDLKKFPLQQGTIHYLSSGLILYGSPNEGYMAKGYQIFWNPDQWDIYGDINAYPLP